MSLTPAEHKESPRVAEHRELWRFGQKLAFVVVVLTALWVWNTAIQVWLLVFAAILFGIVLNRVSCSISTRTPLSRKWALGLVSFTLLSAIILTSWLMAPSFGSQFRRLEENVPRSFNQLRQQLSEHTWGKEALKAANQPEIYLPGEGGVVRRIAGMFSSTLGAVGALVLIIFLGFCFAIEPGIYTEGLLHLFPKHVRHRGREIFAELEDTLAHWLLTRAASMTLVSLLVGIALWALGIPFPLTLALLAGALDFIPNIGPFLAAAPAVLLGFLISPIKALHVATALFAIQVVEAYFITPIIERKAVQLPPALTATAQILLGLSAGILGIALAAPLTATTIVLVKELYVRDYLGDHTVGIGE